MRLTLTDHEFQKILKALQHHPELISLLLQKEDRYNQSITHKKRTATKEAHKSQISRTKKKIENAINLLRIEHREITVYSVSKTANISYNTAKKYENFINIQ